MAPQPFSHCSFCGAPFAAGIGWPRTCASCGQTTYRNPLPVSVVLVPVARDGSAHLGLLAVRRGVSPEAGKLALPGGFINFGETWQEAGAREVFEEAGLVVEPGEIHELTVQSAQDGTLIVFGLAGPRREDELLPFEPNEEATQRLVLDGPAEMAFELQTQVVRQFFRA